jgi:four helix bundle protein
MASNLEDLKILRAAEDVADCVWQQVHTWNEFSRSTVGKQLVRAVDSIGANIAEAFGRFYYGEKIQFLYYGRGSLFETKYWLNRAAERKLLTQDQLQQYSQQLTDLGRRLNAFANSLKLQRRQRAQVEATMSKGLQEPRAVYAAEPNEYNEEEALFGEQALAWLSDCPEQSPISNLQSL